MTPSRVWTMKQFAVEMSTDLHTRVSAADIWRRPAANFPAGASAKSRVKKILRLFPIGEEIFVDTFEGAYVTIGLEQHGNCLKVLTAKEANYGFGLLIDRARAKHVAVAG